MQPFAVSRDGVIKLCGKAAVWRRFDARESEIGECFSAGARACGEQRQRREHGHNADIHAANSEERGLGYFLDLLKLIPACYD